MSERVATLHRPLVAIVGSPNVGKSVVFTHLTGRYATASNYPGTTVEVLRGQLGGSGCEVVDTPGMYSLFSVTEEERVGRRILLSEVPALVIHVVDARNLDRMLPMTVQLIEAGLPVVLVLNMMDEARSAGMEIDRELLSRRLGVSVVGAVAVAGEGMAELRDLIVARLAAPQGDTGFQPVPDRRQDACATLPSSDPARTACEYPQPIAAARDRLRASIDGHYSLSGDALALLLLQGDEEIQSFLDEHEKAGRDERRRLIAESTRRHTRPVEYELALARRDAVSRLLADVVRTHPVPVSFRERLGQLTMNPVTGLPILALVLYLGFYRFVGTFGAGTVVGYLESHLFDKHVGPFFARLAESFLPWPVVQDLFVGDYGVITMGLRYALAIVLPIVTFFFIVFALIEDSGYLPRLAMLLDRAFKKIGLSGRAVIPMVLGFGCATMATLVTRTLGTRRERILATLLLALAVPCSAQLGLILALLGDHPLGMCVWAGVVAGLFVLVGYLGARVLPGQGPSFYIELPPIRVPGIKNVLVKTYVRVKWYLYEIIPLFLLASIVIWLARLTGLFGLAVRALAWPVRWMGLPSDAAATFLFGFFRRDYGAAGLYDLDRTGALDGVQLTVACVALTLFLPCVAQLLMNVKERGWRTGLGISVLVLLVAFGTGIALNLVLRSLGVVL